MTIETSYVGRKARDYEAKRAHTGKWRSENEAVAALLPEWAKTVLDVPVGTGRFLPLYAERGLTVTGVDMSADMLAEAKRKGVPADLCVGDVRSLDFDATTFDVAVCVRLLNWLPPSEMAVAVRELRRVARQVIVGIRTVDGEAEARGRLWKHQEADFLMVARGHEIDGVRPIGGKGYAIYRLRGAA